MLEPEGSLGVMTGLSSPGTTDSSDFLAAQETDGQSAVIGDQSHELGITLDELN